MTNLKELAMIQFVKIFSVITVLTVLAALPAQAQTSNVSYQLHQPITQTLTDTCTGQTVTLSGEYFYEYHFEQQPNGDTHVHWTSHYNLTGVEAGVKYVSTDQQNSDLKMDPDGTFPPVPTSDFHTSDKFKLIAQGPYPKMTMQSFLHVKVDANDNVVVNQDGAPVVKCSGGK
jgi:hypothetical protein